MTRIPSKQVIQSLKEKFPAGTRVELVSMEDPYVKIPSGTKGTVEFVDDTGTIFCSWDNGSSRGAVFGEDVVRKVDSHGV